MFRVRAAVRIVRNTERAHRAWFRLVDRAIRQLSVNTRTTAQRSIRPRRGISLPNRPPHSHVGFLRKLIMFARKSLGVYVVGPVLTRGTGRGIPSALEKGGKTRGDDGEVYLVRARPFMRPAAEHEQRQLPNLLRNPHR